MSLNVPHLVYLEPQKYKSVPKNVKVWPKVAFRVYEGIACINTYVSTAQIPFYDVSFLMWLHCFFFDFSRGDALILINIWIPLKYSLGCLWLG